MSPYHPELPGPPPPRPTLPITFSATTTPVSFPSAQQPSRPSTGDTHGSAPSPSIGPDANTLSRDNNADLYRVLSAISAEPHRSDLVLKETPPPGALKRNYLFSSMEPEIPVLCNARAPLILASQNVMLLYKGAISVARDPKGALRDSEISGRFWRGACDELGGETGGTVLKYVMEKQWVDKFRDAPDNATRTSVGKDILLLGAKAVGGLPRDFIPVREACKRTKVATPLMAENLPKDERPLIDTYVNYCCAGLQNKEKPPCRSFVRLAAGGEVLVCPLDGETYGVLYVVLQHCTPKRVAQQDTEVDNSVDTSGGAEGSSGDGSGDGTKKQKKSHQQCRPSQPYLPVRSLSCGDGHDLKKLPGRLDRRQGAATRKHASESAGPGQFRQGAPAALAAIAAAALSPGAMDSANPTLRASVDQMRRATSKQLRGFVGVSTGNPMKDIYAYEAASALSTDTVDSLLPRINPPPGYVDDNDFKGKVHGARGNPVLFHFGSKLGFMAAQEAVRAAQQQKKSIGLRVDGTRGIMADIHPDKPINCFAIAVPVLANSTPPVVLSLSFAEHIDYVTVRDCFQWIDGWWRKMYRVGLRDGPFKYLLSDMAPEISAGFMAAVNGTTPAAYNQMAEFLRWCGWSATRVAETLGPPALNDTFHTTRAPLQWVQKQDWESSQQKHAVGYFILQFFKSIRDCDDLRYIYNVAVFAISLLCTPVIPLAAPQNNIGDVIRLPVPIAEVPYRIAGRQGLDPSFKEIALDVSQLARRAAQVTTDNVRAVATALGQSGCTAPIMTDPEVREVDHMAHVGSGGAIPNPYASRNAASNGIDPDLLVDEEEMQKALDALEAQAREVINSVEDRDGTSTRERQIENSQWKLNCSPGHYSGQPIIISFQGAGDTYMALRRIKTPPKPGFDEWMWKLLFAPPGMANFGFNGRITVPSGSKEMPNPLHEPKSAPSYLRKMLAKIVATTRVMKTGVCMENDSAGSMEGGVFSRIKTQWLQNTVNPAPGKALVILGGAVDSEELETSQIYHETLKLAMTNPGDPQVVRVLRGTFDTENLRVIASLHSQHRVRRA